MLKITLENKPTVTFEGAEYNFKSAPNGDLWIFQGDKHISTFASGRWLYAINIPDEQFTYFAESGTHPHIAFKKTSE